MGSKNLQMKSNYEIERQKLKDRKSKFGVKSLNYKIEVKIMM